jgi:hypothetical protein
MGSSRKLIENLHVLAWQKLHPSAAQPDLKASLRELHLGLRTVRREPERLSSSIVEDGMHGVAMDMRLISNTPRTQQMGC